MQGGISVSSQSQGRHSHTSTSFMLRTMGSTASTTAVGRLRAAEILLIQAVDERPGRRTPWRSPRCRRG